jgi:hypothetical protein
MVEPNKEEGSQPQPPAPSQTPAEKTPHTESSMVPSIADEEQMDWLENQQRSRFSKWATDLFIIGACLLIVLMFVGVFLVATHHLRF